MKALILLNQPLLPGFDRLAPQPRLPHSYFFALLPPREARDRIMAVCEGLMVKEGLCGKRVAPSRLHVSLLSLGRYREPQAHLVERTKALAATVMAPSFDIAFNGARNFDTGAQQLLVLSGGEMKNVLQLSRMLSIKVDLSRLGGIPSFLPHVTLLYGDRAVMESAIAPIRWTVREFVLIESLIGRGRHIVRGRWPLAE